MRIIIYFCFFTFFFPFLFIPSNNILRILFLSLYFFLVPFARLVRPPPFSRPSPFPPFILLNLRGDLFSFTFKMADAKKPAVLIVGGLGMSFFLFLILLFPSELTFPVFRLYRSTPRAIHPREQPSIRSPSGRQSPPTIGLVSPRIRRSMFKGQVRPGRCQP